MSITNEDGIIRKRHFLIYISLGDNSYKIDYLRYNCRCNLIIHSDTCISFANSDNDWDMQNNIFITVE